MHSWDRFTEPTLPVKDAFYNKLRSQALSDEEYAPALKVSSKFGFNIILDYHHIYLKCMYLQISLISRNHTAPHYAACILTAFSYHTLFATICRAPTF